MVLDTNNKKLPNIEHPIRIGVSGTGYIARGLIALLGSMAEQYIVTSILTRRQISSVVDFSDSTQLTNHIEHLLENSDVVVECSGSVDQARRVIQATLEHSIPTVTLNAEFQLTLGAAFKGSGLLTEAQGDQPGSLAALDEEVRLMGFKPLVYGSQKGFLDHNPSYQDMQKWATLQGISLPAVTAFTDGTKIQIEQALVANCLGAGITRRGLSGPKTNSVKNGAKILGDLAQDLKHPIADYVLCGQGSGAVFIMATHSSPSDQLQYYKLGVGDLYLLERPFHLGHFEIPVTINRILQGCGPLMTVQEQPLHSVLAVAKRDLKRGSFIKRAIGSFDFRGEATEISEAPNHVPIGLLENCTLKENISADQVVCWGDIEFQTSTSVELWKKFYVKP